MINLKATFSRFARPLQPRCDRPLRPEGRLCVVGDIHGRSDLLEAMLGRIEADSAPRGGIDRLVFLGDYIDRGDASAEVLRRLFQLSEDWGDNVVCLAGNHERLMLEFLDDPARAGRRWLRNGGLQTLASFGIGQLGETARGSALSAARDALRARLPSQMEPWLRSLPLSFCSGNLCAVHAALDPALPVSAQPDATLLWGCGAFRTVPRDDDLWVIHGHSIVEAPQVRGAVISVDTGAYATGRLTAAAISPEGEVRFLST